MGTYTFLGVPLHKILYLKNVANLHKSEIRGVTSSLKGPNLMDLGPLKETTSHFLSKSGMGQQLAKRESSVLHVLTGLTCLVVVSFIPTVTRYIPTS